MSLVHETRVESRARRTDDIHITNKPSAKEVGRYGYNLYSLLLVKAESIDVGLPFWVSEVLEVKSSDEYVTGLVVSCYEFY